MKPKVLPLIMLAFCLNSSIGQVIHVPTDQQTIQAGIDAAVDGDTVLVFEGTYYENISFKGKSITVASEFAIDGSRNHIYNTIIDGSQNPVPDSGSVVSFVNGEDTTSILLGFTILGGTGTVTDIYDGARIGGGIVCLNSGARIMHNRIFNNTTAHETFALGGGIGSFSESLDYWVVITENTITDNFVQSYGDASEWRSAAGAGMYIHTNGRIINNDIQSNYGFSNYAADGGGVEIESNYFGGDPFIMDFIGNSVQYNKAVGQELAFGGGLSIYYSRMKIVGNIISNNSLTSDGLNLGAGINLFGGQDLGDLVIIKNNELDSNISGGAGGSLGSAINVLDIDHRLEIRNNQVKGNGHTGEGDSFGTICIKFNSVEMGQSSGVVIEGNRFEMNAMKYGAGLSGLNLFYFSISNNHFLGNSAEYGGAIRLSGESVSGSMSCIANNTFVSNNAVYQGGALYLEYESEAVATFNNIYWQNEAGIGADIFSLIPSSLLVSFSDVDINKIYGQWSGENNFNADPELLEDFLHITDGSPCYNTGTGGICVGNFSIISTLRDIDGESRPMYGGIDIGADEYFTVGLPRENINKELNCRIYPNPCRSYATVSFVLEKPEHGTIEVFNAIGMKIGTFADRDFEAGEHQLRWSAAGLPEGVYFLRIEAGSVNTTARVIHLL